MRILSGLLSCQKFPITFEGAPSLCKRPMGRVVLPLQQMGARISGTAGKLKLTHEDVIYPPLHIKPAIEIKGGRFRLNVSSAQVKSSLMLASLYAKTQTVIIEPYKSRDHTERMFKLFRAKIKTKGTTVICKPTSKLVSPKKLFVPGDFSSAAFFIVLGLILENSKIVIKNVNINPTRCGLLQVLKRMGGKIKIKNKKNAYEPYADIVVESSSLKATKVEPKEIPSMIDDVPVLCVASAFAEGKTEIRGVRELRIKEADRIWSMVHNLSEAGVDIYNARFDNDEEIVIKGGKNHRPASFVSSFDHRIAMSMIIFGMALKKESEIDDIACINKSFPQFLSLVKSLHR
jgi:3-phosphoshikimate 1-carboxyvinyltransferase